MNGGEGFNPEGKTMFAPYELKVTKDSYNDNSTKAELKEETNLSIILYEKNPAAISQG